MKRIKVLSSSIHPPQLVATTCRKTSWDWTEECGFNFKSSVFSRSPQTHLTFDRKVTKWEAVVYLLKGQAVRARDEQLYLSQNTIFWIPSVAKEKKNYRANFTSSINDSQHDRSFLVLEGHVWPKHLVGGRESIRLYSISISIYWAPSTMCQTLIWV